MKNMIIVCNIRSIEQAEDLFQKRVNDSLEFLLGYKPNDILFLDIGGEGNLVFPNIQNRSKQISDALIQLIIQEKNGQDAKEIIDENLNSFSARIRNFRPKISLKMNENKAINCKNCKGIILLGFAAGATCATMTGDMLSKRLNIPISVVAFDPAYVNSYCFLDFERILQKNNIFYLTIIIEEYPIESWSCSSYKQMPIYRDLCKKIDSLIEKNKNIRFFYDKRQRQNLDKESVDRLVHFYAFCTYLFLKKITYPFPFYSGNLQEAEYKFFSSCFKNLNSSVKYFYENQIDLYNNPYRPRPILEQLMEDFRSHSFQSYLDENKAINLLNTLEKYSNYPYESNLNPSFPNNINPNKEINFFSTQLDKLNQLQKIQNPSRENKPISNQKLIDTVIKCYESIPPAEQNKTFAQTLKLALFNLNAKHYWESKNNWN